MSKPGKYVKIPVAVEAMQWTRETKMREMKDFTNDLVRINDVGDEFHVYDRLHDTWVKFNWGDYIIKGVKGEFYPCAQEVFEETYRPEMFTQDEDLMTDEEIIEESKPKKGIPRKGFEPAAVQIYPPTRIAQAVAEYERRAGQR